MPQLQWNHEPTEAELHAALDDVPAWPGSDRTLRDYFRYVVPLRQSHRDRSGVWRDVWSPYVGIAGRIVMWRDAHEHCDPPTEEITNLTVETLPDGRAFVLARVRLTSPKFGTCEDAAVADLQATAGADKTNPWENAITSARVRAIGAFGFGLIPCQGIASAEDMEEVERRKQEERTMESRPRAAQPAVPVMRMESAQAGVQPAAQPPAPQAAPQEAEPVVLSPAAKARLEAIRTKIAKAGLDDSAAAAVIESFAGRHGVDADPAKWDSKTFQQFMQSQIDSSTA